MMRKKISWLFLLTVFLTFFSCRNDYFPEPSTRQYNNASQFQVVKFSDIPQVARFIKLKTGRNDLKIPIKSAHGFSAEAKANINFANLETNFIIKKTENNRVFYISNISNAGDENTLYNFEAREAGGSIVDARIIEYSSEVPFGEKPLEVLSDFTGRVHMYDLQGKETAGITFINGGETCDDNPTDPSSDSGGGGGSGGDDTPPPPPPGPPNWPQNPVPVFGSGGNNGSSGSSGSNGGNNGSSGSNSGGSGTNCGSWQLSHYLYDGPCNGPACSNIVGAVFVNDCNESMPVYLSQNKNSNYAAKTTNFSVPCGGNSGVVVVPDPETTPCEKIKSIFADTKFIEKYNELNKPENFDLDHEKAFIMRYPPIGTNIPPSYFQVDMPPCSTNNEDTVMPSSNAGLAGLMHTHTNTTCSGNYPIKVPSPVDIKYLLNTLLSQANQYTGSYSNAYSITITSEGSYMLMYTGTNYPGSLNYDAVKQLKEDYKTIYNKLMRDDKFTQPNIEREFVKFMKEKINKPGLEVYKVTPTSAIKLEYDPASPNSIKETPCPQF